MVVLVAEFAPAASLYARSAEFGHMAISVTCPGCQAVYPVPENLAGSTIRCKTCSEMMAVPAAPAPVAARPVAATPVAAKPLPAKPVAARSIPADDDDDEPRPARRTRRVRDEEEDEDDAPRRRPARATDEPKKKSKLPLILGGGLGLVVGIGVAVVVAGGMSDGKTDEPVQVAQSTPAEFTPPPETKTPTKISTTRPKADATETTAPEAPKVQRIVPAPLAPITPVTAPQSTGLVTKPGISQERLMSGVMDPVTADRVARATVLIEGEGHDGKRWTGSGWFGLEPNLIFTNAHVLDMKTPDAKPPEKLTIHLYKPDESSAARVTLDRTIPHQRIKILAVDRNNDLAVLRIDNEKDLPRPLKVRASSDLHARQGVTVYGFPLTSAFARISDLSKDQQPEMSVRPSTITSLRTDDTGRPKYVQVEGGVNAGNSGGPIVDAEGNVVAVVVAGVLDRGRQTQLGLAVPTEYVFGLLAGRVDEVEFDQAYRKGGKVHIPITARCLDPLQRLQKVGIGYWVGDPSNRSRPHGEKQSKPLPSDTAHQFKELNYNAATKTATGELVFPELPAGRAYWTQSFYTNALQPNGFWMPGLPVKLSGPPVDRVPTDLIVKLRPGSVRPVELSHTRDLTEYEEGEQESKNEREMIKMTYKLSERVQSGNPKTGTAAMLQFKFQNLDVKSQTGHADEDALPKRILASINASLPQLGAAAQVNSRGEIFRYQSQTFAVANKALAPALQGLSDRAMNALQAASIPLPNKKVSPMEKWESKKIGRLYQLKLNSAGDSKQPTQARPGPRGRPGMRPRPGPQPGARPAPRARVARELKYEQRITYTYLGMRQRQGSNEAVIRIEGAVGPAPGSSAAASGQIKGYATIECETGTVVFAEIESDFEVDSSSEGLRKKVSGISKYTLTRGSSAK
jgi:S1-C subfamily serine protease